MKSEQSKKEIETRYKQVTEIYESGVTSAAEIGRITSIPPRTVLRLIRLWESRTQVEEVKGKGRPPKMSPKYRSFIGSELARNPFQSSRDIQLRLSEMKNIDVIHQSYPGYRSNCSKPSQGNWLFK